MAEFRSMHRTPSTTASPAPQCLPRADGPSPTKRRKVTTSGPESVPSTDPSSILRNPHLDAERHAAAQRVLDVWSTLEDKYARRLEEDDIVDLRTGRLVRDRGVLSGSTRRWNFGCFADAIEDSGAEPEEDSEDELGSWGSEMDRQFKPIYVPPVQEFDPEDAEDLRDFLVAEEKRRAFGGDEDDANFDGPWEDDEGEVSTDDYGLTETDLDNDGSVVDVEAGSALAPSDEDSPDELEGYDDTVGEGALLWEVESDKEEIPSDAEHPQIPASPIPPLRRLHTPAQLRTPPLSRSSDVPSNALIRTPGNQLETEPQGKNKLSPSGGKRKESRSSFLTPTKKLIPEVVITSRRASIMKALDFEETPTKSVGQPRRISLPPLKKYLIPTKRRMSESSPSKPVTVSETSAKSYKISATSKRPAKRKHVLSAEEESEEEEGEEEVGHTLVPEDEEDEKVPVSLHQSPRKSSTYPPHFASPAPSNLWSPYSRHNSVGPSYPESFMSTQQPTPLDTQLIVAQVMQNLCYFVHANPEGSPRWAHPAQFLPSQHAHPPGPSHRGSPHSLPGPSHPAHLQYTPSHTHHPQRMSSQIPPPQSYHSSPQHTPSCMPPPHTTPPHSHPQLPPNISPHPFQQSHSSPPHPLWFFPPYPYPHPYTPDAHTHPQPPPSSSASSFDAGPPSSAYSSPLFGKGKGKRVSFPDEWPTSEEDAGEDRKKGERPLKARGSPKKTAAQDSAATARNWELGRDSGESFRKRKPDRALAANSGRRGNL